MKICTMAGCKVEAPVKYLGQFYCVRHAMDAGVPTFVVAFGKVNLLDLGYASQGEKHKYHYVVDGDREWLVFERDD